MKSILYCREFCAMSQVCLSYFWLFCRNFRVDIRFFMVIVGYERLDKRVAARRAPWYLKYLPFVTGDLGSKVLAKPSGHGQVSQYYIICHSVKYRAEMQWEKEAVDWPSGQKQGLVSEGSPHEQNLKGQPNCIVSQGMDSPGLWVLPHLTSLVW